MDKLFTALFAILGGLMVIAFVCLIISLPVMLLWDWVMPALFGLKEITWLQSLGLLLLSSLLFKSSK